MPSDFEEETRLPARTLRFTAFPLKHCNPVFARFISQVSPIHREWPDCSELEVAT